MYCDQKDSIFIFLNQISAGIPTYWIRYHSNNFFFLILNILMLDAELPQKIIL